jgi:hypothetical protein
MKKYSEVIPQKLNESIVLGQPVYEDMQDPNFAGFVKTMSMMNPAMQTVIESWDEILQASSGKGMRLFKKGDTFFLDAGELGIFSMKVEITVK